MCASGRRLIQVATDSHLWSQTYDRQLDDIFAVQDDIAQEVVKELRTALLQTQQGPGGAAQVEAEVREAVKGRSLDAEAYQLYLQGRFLVDRLNAEHTAKGIEYYRKALALHRPRACVGVAGTGLCRPGGVRMGAVRGIV